MCWAARNDTWANRARLRPQAAGPARTAIDSGRAVSRILSALSRAERIICLSSQYPEPVPQCGTWSGPLQGPLFGLAPDGVFRASALSLGAVGSYPTFSPLPRPRFRGRGGLIFCGTIRRDASRHRLPRVSRRGPSCVGPAKLRGIAPFGVRTFHLPRIASGKAILRPSKTTVNIRCRRQDDKLPTHSATARSMSRV